MKLLQTTAIAGLLVASGAASALELSGNVALTTDYVWRGISQTDGSPAIQGGFDADLGNGLYAGVWGSNVDFGDDDVGGDDSSANVEIDLYAGWAGEFNGVGVDVGVLHYAYPTSGSDTDFTEVYVGLSMGPASITQYFGVDAGSDDIGDADYGNYTDIALDLGEYAGIALAAHVGYYDLNSDNGDYWDWKLAASTSYLGVDWEVAYSDVDNADVVNNDDPNLVLTVSKSL
ncbi:MAG: TorF family putative porin [Cycloclasticus sp.]